MEFKQLESFAAVVRLQSFTRAAEQLYISQPTISTHIRALEEELNMRLILRTTKSIEVTPEGQKFYEYAVNILQLRDRMLQECSSEAKRIIHLGASTIPSAYILPDVLPEFGAKFPNTFFIIHQSDSKGVIDGLVDGIFDVGLLGMECQRDSMTCEAFCEDRMVLITPVADRFLNLQNNGVSAAELLTQEPVILREKGSGSMKGMDRFLEQMGIAPDQLHVTARINDPEAIKNLVAQGLGISIISQRAARNFIREKRLLSFELPENANSRQLYLTYRTDHADSVQIREFVDFVKRFYNTDSER